MGKRCAICLRGAISKVTCRFQFPNQLYDDGPYVNYRAVHKSIMEHIIRVNPDWEFDFFIQCWNLDLQDDLVNLYNPKGILFEDNNLYRDEILKSLQCTGRPLQDFGTTSQLLAISKSIGLMKSYVQVEKRGYDRVLCYRPDVLIWKDMILDTYDIGKIYVNAHPNAVGDFHFIMNMANAFEFMKIYETTTYTNIVTSSYLHGKIKLYADFFMHDKLIIDDIKPGVNQEVLRKLGIAIKDHGLDIENFYKYGLTKEEIESYVIN